MDVAVTVVAAFGGGLAGAILQPLTEYLVGRRRASDERLRADRRDARKIVETEILHADMQHSFARRSSYVFEGDPPPEEKIKLLQQGINDLWQNVELRPVLLRDEELEQDLDELKTVIWGLMYDAQSLLRNGPREERLTPDKSREAFERYGQLRIRILERLDELGW